MSSIFSLTHPQSLGVHDEYVDAQRAVDHLADHGFPVQHVLIVGTDLKQVERVTGRLTTARVALGGALSGVWLGLFVGLLIGFFAPDGDWWRIVGTATLLGVGFGSIWALLGYAATRGQRDFSSVKTVVASRYEVLVEHAHLGEAQQLLAGVTPPD
ncbi:hypothetical protein HMPREF0063_10894 [Aeromicrobium marinum DSM 15272]|uniref:General stress protein 17M-like domain-containing protein n=1 Tax=Aeromicrobium marinum DSM 15272 TaxID=585531 RepID=E2SAA4_9ACTN|nr:general stress protein [Aeromicrobium marinum]EFQ84178.1 hypothetical protein HMPREF0063_10894 [Aeromicrobium marinum DSM 15272]